MYLSLGEKNISTPMYILSKGYMGYPSGTWAPERAFPFLQWPSGGRDRQERKKLLHDWWVTWHWMRYLLTAINYAFHVKKSAIETFPHLKTLSNGIWEVCQETHMHLASSLPISRSKVHEPVSIAFVTLHSPGCTLHPGSAQWDSSPAVIFEF